MRIVPVLLVLLASVQLVVGKPAQIILLRHAEKPADEWDPHLSAQGRERAFALVALMTNAPTLITNGPPAALFASRPTPRGHGVRTSETLEPLAKDLHLAIQTPYFAAEYEQLAKDIMNQSEYDGKTVIVCWVHTYLPELAKAFGVKSPPAYWKAEVFDRLWLINLQGKKPKLAELKQKVLPGDSRKSR